MFSVPLYITLTSNYITIISLADFVCGMRSGSGITVLGIVGIPDGSGGVALPARGGLGKRLLELLEGFVGEAARSVVGGQGLRGRST